MLRNMKRLRNEKGISQQMLGRTIGVSQQSVNGYENHDIEPDISTLIRIADYFETSVDYIVGHTHIRRKVEEVSEYALNENESKLIDRYRSLPPSGRRVLDELISDIVQKAYPTSGVFVR